MNKYKNFAIDDWLNDVPFREWVYFDKSSDSWATYLAAYPEQLQDIEKAKTILLAVTDGTTKLSQSEINENASTILSKLDRNARTGHVVKWWQSRWLQVASVFLIAVTLGFLALIKTADSIGTNQLVSMLSGDNDVQVINSTQDFQSVQLPDGSSVILKRNGKLTYPLKFEEASRIVNLEGEAFFEVKKNSKQPFYVYTGAMITKVTGTSFSIRANRGEKEIGMVVKTGVVKIYADDSSEREANILTANQKASFMVESKLITVEQVDKPVLIDLPAETQTFAFKRTPIVAVLHELEQGYGVEFETNDFDFDTKTLTAQLGDEPLESKLEMIGAAIGARFEMKGKLITINKN